MTPLPCAVILAAGQGSRYRQAAGGDQDKLLAPCRGCDGVMRPVLEQVLVNLPVEMLRRVLVTTPGRPQVVALARAYGCQVLLLDSLGMGQSLAAAVAASADAAGWVILLGDMPFILPSTVTRVIEGLTEEGISVPRLGDDLGHPVGFGRAYGAALQGLSGDRGARCLFAPGKVVEVSVTDPGVLWDVDRPEALVYRDR
ncbi:molybdopterin-guanine dinucleotide biosynthesis protein MobA [Pseudomonas protegens]|uniref:nucleotidyltransferase family protein n=1 Tax=Pseudomonas protegens TaxID=380021 RepID=UPI000F4B4B4B|nr:nucleotidyltransferase family protein [Pseudomonas protegens]ROL74936.1 molybdopterin-guanine dinucleotide biosynthesis protein MobA [Pseudomonas protegens]